LHVRRGSNICLAKTFQERTLERLYG